MSSHPIDSALPSGAVAPGQLNDARLQCHHAAQVIVSLGISLLPHRADDSHTNLGWEPDLGALTTHPVPGRVPFRGGLAIRELELLLESGEGVVRFPLDGATLAEAWQWLVAAVARAGGDSDKLTGAKHYTIPGHPVAEGRRFQRKPETAFAELAGYYELAERVLRALAAGTAGASDVRCWPHHFDLATLITLPGSPTRTVGAGLSPGDESYAMPYFYVSPYPYPEPGRLGTLALGHWHTQGWTGAVLTGDELLGTGSVEDRASSFLQGAVDVCLRSLHG
jgi:hypothetical protein